MVAIVVAVAPDEIGARRRDQRVVAFACERSVYGHNAKVRDETIHVTAMRLSAEWMTMADDRVLEYLREEGTSTPKQMADDERIRFSRSYVNARCTELARRSFVLNLGNGVYQITYRGQQYLDGELDAADLETSAEAA
jgi:hypothetical protein